MKKFLLSKINILFIVLLQAVYLSANQTQNTEQTCPPPCKGDTAYVFSTSFCCQKKDKKSVACQTYALNGTQERYNQCDTMDNVSVEYYDLNLYPPLSPASEAKKDLNNPPFEDLPGVKKSVLTKTIYDCPGKNISMYVQYNPGDAFISASVYHKDTNTTMMLDSHLEYNLDPRSNLVQQTIRNLQDYLCDHWDPMQFFRTYKAHPFSFPNYRKSKATNTPTVSSAASSSSAVNTSTKAAPKKNTWHVLGENFYIRPKHATKPDTVQFISADKRKNLYIRFSSKKKSLYLQSLEEKYASLKHATTTCQNGNVLFETNDKTYKAYILSGEAISILTTPPAKVPSSSTKQDILCSFSAAEAKQF